MLALSHAHHQLQQGQAVATLPQKQALGVIGSDKLSRKLSLARKHTHSPLRHCLSLLRQPVTFCTQTLLLYTSDPPKLYWIYQLLASEDPDFSILDHDVHFISDYWTRLCWTGLLCLTELP